MKELLSTEKDLGFPPCMVPPKGWVCTRDPGHEGPRAAHPVGGEIAAAQIERFKDCLKAANLAFLKSCMNAAAMKAVLDELEGAFDQETYTERAVMDFDAHDDHEFTVTITAKQLRSISRAIIQAERRS